jgi:glycosyltransferase involved in cell wall biosynthesis
MLIGAEGEAGYTQRIIDRAKDAGVSERLLCTGHVKNPHPLVKQARCFVSASADEGLGLAALEAMALRVPVVSTMARGIVDFVRHQETGLFAAAEPTALAANIMYLDSQPNLAARLKAKAASVVNETYSWAATIGKYSETFHLLHQ